MWICCRVFGASFPPNVLLQHCKVGICAHYLSKSDKQKDQLQQPKPFSVLIHSCVLYSSLCFNLACICRSVFLPSLHCVSDKILIIISSMNIYISLHNYHSNNNNIPPVITFVQMREHLVFSHFKQHLL